LKERPCRRHIERERERKREREGERGRKRGRERERENDLTEHPCTNVFETLVWNMCAHLRRAIAQGWDPAMSNRELSNNFMLRCVELLYRFGFIVWAESDVQVHTFHE